MIGRKHRAAAPPPPAPSSLRPPVGSPEAYRLCLTCGHIFRHHTGRSLRLGPLAGQSIEMGHCCEWLIDSAHPCYCLVWRDSGVVGDRESAVLAGLPH